MFTILDEVCTPTKGSKYSACVDLYAREDVVIGVGETGKVPLGICLDDFKLIDTMKEYFSTISITKEEKEKFLSKHYLELHPRSSLSLKGLICNIGIIDMDYKDEICLIVHNPVTDNEISNEEFGVSNVVFYGIEDSESYTIKKGQKIAQIMLKEHKTGLLCVTSNKERTGGFGSTGN